MKRLACFIAACCGLFATAAVAYTPVVNVATVANLNQDLTGAQQINLANYSTSGDGGGGILVPCVGTCTVDNGVVFQDSRGHKFLRQFTGEVLMPWYGVQDAISNTCTASTNYAACDATTQFNNALTAALAYGNGVVGCGGLAIAITSGNLYIPPNGGIDCDIPPGGVFNQHVSNGYWLLPNSIVMNPQYTIYGDTRTGRQNLNVRPTWCGRFRPAGFTSGTTCTPTTVHDVQYMRRLFTGTGITGAGEASNLNNIFVLGFDTGIDQSASADANMTFAVSDNNVDVFLWGQRGGYFAKDLRAKPVMALRDTDPVSGNKIDLVRWPVTSAAADGNNQIVLTVNNAFNATSICSSFSVCMETGYTILLDGLASFNNRVNTTGAVYSSSQPTVCAGGPTTYCITNVPNTTNNGQDGIDSIQIGSTIQDNGSAGCVFSGITVVGKDTDLNIVWMSGAPTGCSPDPTSKTESLTFVSSSGGPAGANGRWLAGVVTTGPDTVTLVGTSYTGPTYTGVKWTAGSNVLKVYDTTNILLNQFVCSSGSGPFCTPPTAFAAGTTTTTGLNNTITGSILVGSTAHWPSPGYLKTSDNCSGNPEWMSYIVVDATHVNIKARGIDGTTTCSHAGTITITPSAPMVIQTIPEPESTATNLVLASVVISSTAQTTEGAGQTVGFLNDNTVTSGLSGELVLNANYQTWTGNMHAGSGPYGPMVTIGSTNSNNTLTNVSNTYKIQPGMTVVASDITPATAVTATGTWTAFTNTMTISGASGTVYQGMSIAGTGIPNGTLVVGVNGASITFSKRATVAGSGASLTFTGTVVTSVPSIGTVVFNSTASATTAGEKISFAGCGYPYSGTTPEPWLGNCQATTFQFGSLTDASNQGAKFVNVQSFGKPSAMSLYNSPDTKGLNVDFSNGSGVGAQIDNLSVGLDIEGPSNDSIHITNGSIKGSTIGIFMNLTSRNNDTIGVNDISMGIDAGLMFGITGTGGTVNLHSLGGHSPNVAYYGPSTMLLNLVNNQLASTIVYTDTPALGASPPLMCSANFFANSFCSGTPTTTAATVTALLAGNWGNNSSLSLLGYYTIGDGGGGTLVPTTFGSAICPVVDNGSCFQDSGGNYLARQNLGGDSGQVNALYFGCKPDAVNGVSASSFDNTACMTAALTAASAQHLSGISLNGNSTGSGWLVSSGLTINSGVFCTLQNTNRVEGSGNVSYPNTGDYRNYPCTLWIPSSASISLGTTTVSSGELNGVNVLRTNLNTTGAAPTGHKDLLAMAQAFAGTGVIIAGDGARIRNSNILGFATGISINGPREFRIEDTQVDATNCLNDAFQRGGGTIDLSSLQCNQLTTGLNVNDLLELAPTSVTTDTHGHLQVNLTATCPGQNCPSVGEEAWVLNPPGVQSANGQGWILDAGSDTSHWILHGSTDAFLSGQTFTANFSANSQVITLTANADCQTTKAAICQVQPGQTITGSCLPANAVVSYVEPFYGAVVIGTSSPALTLARTTCAGSAVTVTITDAAATSFPMSIATVNNGGSGYTNADFNRVCTISGGTFSVQATVTIRGVSGGAVTSVIISNEGVYTVAAATPNTPTCAGTSGTGLTLNLGFNGALGLLASMREGVGLNMGAVISTTITAPIIADFRTGILSGNGSNGNTIISPQIYTEQVFQDNNIFGILFSGTTQGNTVVGGGIHAYGGNVVSRAAASSALASNRFFGTSIGGNNNLSGNNQILFSAEGNTLGGCGGVSCAHTRLEMNGITSQSAAIMFVTDDIYGVGLTSSTLPNAQVVCQSDNTNTLIKASDVTLASGGCDVFSNVSQATGIIAPTSTPYYANQCGQQISSANAGAQLQVILPTVVRTGCELSFLDDTVNGYSINPNGVALSTTQGDYKTSPFSVGPSTTALGSILTIEYNGSKWVGKSGAPGTITGSNILNGQVRKQGDVYLSCNASCGGAGSALQLCPYLGNGGIVINGALERIENSCVFLPDTATTGASRYNYIYVHSVAPTVSGAVNNGSGLVRVTLSSIQDLQNNDTLCLFNIGGTTEANGCWQLSNVGAVGNSADLVGSTFTNAYTTGGNGWYHALKATPSTDGHSTLNGVEVRTANNIYTLVGIAYIDAGQHFDDSAALRNVASWYNRQLKKMTVKLGAVAATTTSATYVTPTSNTLEGAFVTFGSPGTPGTIPVPTVQWSITASAANSNAGTTNGIGICFGTTSLGTNTACGGTVEPEDAVIDQGVAASNQLYAPVGATTALSEGRNFADIVMKASANTFTLKQSAASLDTYVMQ